MTNIEKLLAKRLKEGLTPYHLESIICTLMDKCPGCPLEKHCWGREQSVTDIDTWATQEAEVNDDEKSDSV